MIEEEKKILENQTEIKEVKEVKEKELTEKEKMFVKEYIVDFNATQAAIRAGYSKKTARNIASQNLAKLHIQKEIMKKIKKRADRVELTADYVLGGLMEVAERCLQRKPVMYFDYEDKCMKQKTEVVTDENGEEQEIGVWEFDSRGANTAFTKLGEHLALFKKVLLGDPDRPLFNPIRIITPPETMKKIDEGTQEG